MAHTYVRIYVVTVGTEKIKLDHVSSVCDDFPKWQRNVPYVGIVATLSCWKGLVL